jgi:hypothetical protein
VVSDVVGKTDTFAVDCSKTWTTLIKAVGELVDILIEANLVSVPSRI